jgi:predicted ATPase/class 3 adenylate cyclase
VEGVPSGTVTFLFTDVEGSTALWESDPDSMRLALERHDEAVRAAVDAHGGRVFATGGDGFAVGFARATDAVAAAVEAQVSLWRLEGSVPVLVRMGIHTGEAVERGGDYFGPTVNRAARLMAVGHGGQVLCSGVTAGIVAESLPDGCSLFDLGDHRLRDLGRPERVFQVRHRDLVVEFPPLASLDAVPGELPVLLTSFVGRDRDVESVLDALDQFRIVTVIGPGGIGKTRLALQAAGEALVRYPDGAWFCELAPVVDRSVVAEAVAGCLGLRLQPGEPAASTLVACLRRKRLLLVLDNCEHVLDEAGSLAEAIVHACPGVTVLATSREALAADGERLWPLGSLPVPDPNASLEEAAATPAVRLFTDRARAVRPGFNLDATSVTVVADVCRQLDGMPLAIELAAARVGGLSVGEIAGRLDRRLRLLTGGRRTAVARHQTLRNTIDWSYDLLETSEAEVFARLALFTGGFTSAAADAVVSDGGIAVDDVLDILSHLVARSMLVGDDIGTTTRYRMLETIRQYARERLDATGQSDRIRRRHAEYYTGLAEQVAAGLKGRDEQRWAATTDLELHNFAAALDWSVDAQDPELALRLANALVGVMADLAGLGSVGRPRAAMSRTIRAALDMPEARRHPLRAPAMAHATLLSQVLWEDAGAMSTWVAATDAAFDEAGLEPTAEALFAHAVLASMTGLVPQLRTFGDPAIDKALTDGDHHLAGIQCAILAMCLTAARQHDAAVGRAEQAHALASKVGNPSLRAFAELSLGFALSPTDPDAAIKHLQAALHQPPSRLDPTGDVGGRCLARLLAGRGELAAALETYAGCLDRAMGIGARFGVTLACDSLAVDLAAAGHHDVAATLFGALEAPLAGYRGNPLIARDTALESLHRAMAPRFEQRAARGRAMDVDDLGVYARAEIRRILTATSERPPPTRSR